MDRLAKIRDELTTRADASLRPDCIRILDFLSEQPDDRLAMLSWKTLAEVTGRRHPDQLLISAVAYLSNSPLHVLVTGGIFVDHNEEEFILEPKHLHDAYVQGEFAHPQTGDLVPDFLDRIFTFFFISERFKEIKRAV
jgi:hypothetical protein